MTTQMGTILIADLEVRCIVGILPRERVEPQPLFLDLEMDHDFGPAAATEDVTTTVDYAEVSRVLAEQIKARQYWLIETLAVEGCATLLARYPGLQRVKITVKKPQAVAETRHVGVVFEQRRAQ